MGAVGDVPHLGLSFDVDEGEVLGAALEREDVNRVVVAGVAVRKVLILGAHQRELAVGLEVVLDDAPAEYKVREIEVSLVVDVEVVEPGLTVDKGRRPAAPPLRIEEAIRPQEDL